VLESNNDRLESHTYSSSVDPLYMIFELIKWLSGPREN